MSFFGFFAVILGPLMRVLYSVINNYALTMIIFTLIIRVLMMPLMITQQKSMAKMSVFQPMLNDLQKKYANNQQKYQEEMMKLQTEYGFNPMAGCWPMLLNMVVLFGIIEVVYRPVQYILGVPVASITAACEALGLAGSPITMQTGLIQAIHNGAAIAGTGLTEAEYAAIQGFNTSFFGLDICSIAGIRLTPLVIFPIIAGVTMIVSMEITQRLSGSSAQMQGSMKVTMWIMNLWFIYYCFSAPIGFSLYYGTSNICQMVQSFISYKIYSPEKFKAQYEEELARKKSEKKEKKTVKVTENGKAVEKQVSTREAEKLRLEEARRQDELKYANERTVPLTPEERAAQQAADSKKKK